MGTLKNVSASQKIETPVAENLMVGLAMGMSFEGFKPVVYFERHDFMLVAADAIGNHVDKIERISHGEYKAPIIFKTVTDDGGLFYSGPTHSQNFTSAFRELFNFPVLDPQTPEEVLDVYRYAKESDGATMIVERKSFH
jgi:pyruvate dehydrogenase E1 component beta subunit